MCVQSVDYQKSQLSEAALSVTPFLRLVRQRCVAERKGETDGLLPNDKPNRLQNQTDEPNFEPRSECKLTKKPLHIYDRSGLVVYDSK